MNQWIEFETRRLRLRQWREADKEPFAALNADPEVMEYFPATLGRSESDAMTEKCRALIAERGWGFWATELLATGEFIGFVGLHQPVHHFPFAPCVEIGWRLARPYWGLGYATEAALGALAVGFEQLGPAEIVSFTYVGNGRSRAVMERLGMQPDNNTFDHPGLAEGHRLREHCLYRMPRELWCPSH